VGYGDLSLSMVDSSLEAEADYNLRLCRKGYGVFMAVVTGISSPAAATEDRPSLVPPNGAISFSGFWKKFGQSMTSGSPDTL